MAIYGGTIMDSRSLMIGDWVLIEDTLRRVAQLTKHQVVGYHLAEGECVMHYARLCETEPIPLTPEILEKNGWKEAQFWHEYQDGKNTIQSCLPEMRGIINGVEIQHFKCEYVHQYQHLLRLCGLEELADEFEID